MSLSPFDGILLASQIALYITILWATGLFFAQAFPCSISSLQHFAPRCFRTPSLDIAITTWNVSTDIALVIIPYFMMQKVRVAAQKRWTVIVLFGSRLIVTPIAVIQLLDARSSQENSKYVDASWANAIPLIWEQVCLSFSIITACVYCVKHYLKEMSRFLSVYTEEEPVTSERRGEANIEWNGEGLSGVTKRDLRTLFGGKSAEAPSNATTVRDKTEHPYSDVTTITGSHAREENDGPWPAPKNTHFETMDQV